MEGRDVDVHISCSSLRASFPWLDYLRQSVFPHQRCHRLTFELLLGLVSKVY